MIVRIGSHTFDDVLFDRERDVLYMHKGKPVPASETIATPEGHAVMLDESGEIIGITIVNARWLAERDGLLEVHKLMYFLEASGEPLRLKYVKAPYGPYANNLRHVLRDVNGHLIEGYTAEGDDPTEQVGLLPGAVESSDVFLAQHPDTLRRLSRVGELVEGFETPFGLELLATAHWVISKEQPSSEREIEEAVYAWGPRKEQFTPAQIAIAVAQLRAAGFADAESIS